MCAGRETCGSGRHRNGEGIRAAWLWQWGSVFTPLCWTQAPAVSTFNLFTSQLHILSPRWPETTLSLIVTGAHTGWPQDSTPGKGDSVELKGELSLYETVFINSINVMWKQSNYQSHHWLWSWMKANDRCCMTFSVFGVKIKERTTQHPREPCFRCIGWIHHLYQAQWKNKMFLCGSCLQNLTNKTTNFLIPKKSKINKSKTKCDYLLKVP